MQKKARVRGPEHHRYTVAMHHHAQFQVFLADRFDVVPNIAQRTGLPALPGWVNVGRNRRIVCRFAH